MTPNQFEIFSDFRDEFCTYCMKMNKAYGDLLKPLQIAASADDTPDYPVETPVVYNSALDEITEKPIEETQEEPVIAVKEDSKKEEQPEILDLNNDEVDQEFSNDELLNVPFVDETIDL